MSKKNSLEEKLLIEDEEIPQPQPKPKRQISDAQREHLNNIRAKALEKKREMKSIKLKCLNLI